jgi:hypothetical protein
MLSLMILGQEEEETSTTCSPGTGGNEYVSGSEGRIVGGCDFLPSLASPVSELQELLREQGVVRHPQLRYLHYRLQICVTCFPTRRLALETDFRR